MATSRTSRRAAPVAAQAAAPSPALLSKRIEIRYVDITDIVPYEWNPRDNSKAIPAVAASIQNFGFVIPCVIDSNNILVAGHTRVEAAKTLGMTEVPCVIADHLSPEQINAFRVMDNKVAEQASWNHELLAGEIGKFADLGLDLTQFGYTQNEIDCLSELVAADCLNATTLVAPTVEAGTTNTPRRGPQTARFVLGELVFFIPVQQYKNWADGIRQLHNFDEEAIADDIKTRLGILN